MHADLLPGADMINSAFKNVTEIIRIATPHRIMALATQDETHNKKSVLLYSFSHIIIIENIPRCKICRPIYLVLS